MNEIYGLYCVCDNCKDTREKIRYVGQTSRGTRDRFYKHTYNARHRQHWPVCRWMYKHGVENIRWRVLETVDTPEELDEAETRWIQELGTLIDEGGYNLWPGGGSVRGYKHSEDALSRRRGWKHSEETKKLLSEKMLGKTGEASPRSIINDEIALDIKNRLWAGDSTWKVAKDLGLTKGLISGVSRGTTWTHVPWPIGPRYRKSNGRFTAGTRNQAKITESDVREIRDLYSKGVSYKQIAARYNMTDANVSMIVRRKTWKHVE